MVGKRNSIRDKENVNISPLRCIMWGSGDYANRAVKHIKKVNKELNSVCDAGLYKIEAIVDSDEKKRGMDYNGYSVIMPSEINFDDYDALIIAIRNHAEIDSFLNKINISTRKYYYDDVISEKIVLDWFAYHKVDLMELIRNGVIGGKYGNKIRSLHMINRDASENIIVGYGTPGDHSLIPSDFVGALQCYYGEEVNKIQFRFEKSEPGIKNNINTVAFIYPKLYNGGVERVVSQLFELFELQTDYNLIFICEENKTRGDYSLPKGVKRIQLSKNTRIDRWFWLHELNEIIDTEHIDILVSHDSFNIYNFYLGLLCRYKSCSFLVENHNAISESQKNIDRLSACYGIADAIVVLSEMAKEFWTKKGIKAFYIPNPVNINIDDKYDADRRIAKRILWVGRLNIDQKRVLDVVTIMSKVVRRVPDIYLIVVGEEDKSGIKDRLLSEIKKHGLEKNVILKGFLKDVSDEYRKASLMIMTSAFEGFPMVIVESKRYGLPLVLYDLPDIELLSSGEGYVSVPQGDHESFANAIIDIINDNDKLNDMSIQAINSLRPFATVNVVGEWIKVFKTIRRV